MESGTSTAVAMLGASRKRRDAARQQKDAEDAQTLELRVAAFKPLLDAWEELADEVWIGKRGYGYGTLRERTSGLYDTADTDEARKTRAETWTSVALYDCLGSEGARWSVSLNEAGQPVFSMTHGSRYDRKERTTLQQNEWLQWFFDYVVSVELDPPR